MEGDPGAQQCKAPGQTTQQIYKILCLKMSACRQHSDKLQKYRNTNYRNTDIQITEIHIKITDVKKVIKLQKYN